MSEAGDRARWRHSRLGELTISASVMVCTLVLVLLGAEAGVRFLEPRSDKQPLYQSMKASPRIWGLMPNRTVLRNGVIVHTNGFGERGGDIPIEKAAGTFRMVGLGDSYAFGSGVKFEETYLERLQEMLNSRQSDTQSEDKATGSAEKRAEAPAPPGPVRFESVNLGVEGYNTVQEFAALRELGVPLHPDLVLLEYLFNDVEDSSTPNEAMRPGHPTVRGHGVTWLITSLREKSHLFAFVSPRVGALLRMVGVKRTGLVGSYASQFEDGDPGWTRSRRALLAIDSLATACGSRFAVVVFPAFVSLRRKDYPLLAYHEAVTGFCRSHGIPVLDLFPAFEGQQANRYWMSLTDPHPNGAANKVAAEAIYRFVIAQGLVPVGTAPGRIPVARASTRAG